MLFIIFEGNYRGAAALYEQIIQENPDSLTYHEVGDWYLLYVVNQSVAL